MALSSVPWAPKTHRAPPNFPTVVTVEDSRSAGGSWRSPARLWRRLSSLAGAVLTALLLLAGCTAPAPAHDVQRSAQGAATAAASRIDQTLSGLDKVGERVGRSVVDSCQTGQHNWKRNDPYDVICSVTVTHAYRVTGETFRGVADEVNDQFNNCPDGESFAEWVLRNYWDELAGKPTRNFPGPYRPDYLPSYGFHCAPGVTPSAPTEVVVRTDPTYSVRAWVTLPVGEGAVKAHRDEMGVGCYDSELSPCTRSGDEIDTVWDRVKGHPGWVVFVIGSSDYVRTP